MQRNERGGRSDARNRRLSQRKHETTSGATMIPGVFEGRKRAKCDWCERGRVFTFVPKHPALVRWKATDAEVQAACRTIGPVVLSPAHYTALEAASRVCTNRHQWQATIYDGSIVKVTGGKMWSSSTPDPATHEWVPVLCGRPKSM